MTQIRIGVLLLCAAAAVSCGGEIGPATNNATNNPSGLADGSVCQEDLDCASTHCGRGVCCAQQDCCLVDGDCVAGYTTEPTCADPIACQGTRRQGVCQDFGCVAVEVDDDSGCGPDATPAHCGLYAPASCDGSVEQVAPECPTSCGADDDSLCAPQSHCDGGVCISEQPGTTSIRLRGWSPYVPVTVLGADTIDFLVDTGSPVTVLDLDVYPGTVGEVDASPQVFGGTFAAPSAVRFDIFGSPPAGAILIVGGIVGGDLLRGHTMTIDYQTPVGSLRGSSEPPLEPAGDVFETQTVGFELLGGGSFSIPGDGSTGLSATRVVLEGSVEGHAADMVLDTGASHSIIAESLFNSLGDSARPMLGGVRVTRSTGTVEVSVSRVSSLAVGTSAVSGATVMVMPDSTLSSVSAETGRDIKMLLGGTYLRYFLLAVDYDSRELGLAEYADPSHVNPNEWIGPGLKLNDGPAGDYLVGDVYDGTDAQAAGFEVGDRVTEIDGQPTSNYSLAEVRHLLTTFPVGTDLAIGLKQGDAVTTIDVTVEDLLPSYP